MIAPRVGVPTFVVTLFGTNDMYTCQILSNNQAWGDYWGSPTEEITDNVNHRLERVSLPSNDK